MTCGHIRIALPTHTSLIILLISSLILITPGARIVEDPYRSSYDEDDDDNEGYDPYDFIAHDVNGLSDYSTQCTPLSWSQWTPCTAPNCKEKGISIRKQRSRNCHVEMQQRDCVRICDENEGSYHSVIGQSLGEVFEDEDDTENEVENEQDEDEDRMYVPGQPDRSYFEDDIQREFDELRQMGYNFGNTYRNLEEETNFLSGSRRSEDDNVQTEITNSKSDDYSNSDLTANANNFDNLGTPEEKWKHYNEYNHDPDGTIDNGFMPHEHNFVTEINETEEVPLHDNSENVGHQSADEGSEDKNISGDADKGSQNEEKKTGESESYVSLETADEDNNNDGKDEKDYYGYSQNDDTEASDFHYQDEDDLNNQETIDEKNENDGNDGNENDTDDGNENDTDYGNENDTDYGNKSDVDDGNENDVDDGNENDVDDGNENDTDDGNKSDVDDGNENDVEAADDNDGDDKDKYDNEGENDEVNEDKYNTGDENDDDEDEFSDDALTNDVDDGNESDEDDGNENDVEAADDDDGDDKDKYENDEVNEDEYNTGDENDDDEDDFSDDTLTNDGLYSKVKVDKTKSYSNYISGEKLTEEEEFALLAMLEGKVDFKESLKGWDVRSLSDPDTSGESLSSYSLDSTLGMMNGTLGSRNKDAKSNNGKNNRVLTTYKDKCIHLWKTGDTKSGRWTECCNKMNYRFKLEWVKSPPTGLICPPKIRKEKCRKKVDCNVCRYGEWENWGKCSVKCGGGTMTRYRQVITGGSECNEVVETDTCRPHECGCEVSDWSEWSNTCSSECQNARATDTTSRTRKVVTNYNNAPCPDLTETEPCDLTHCCKYTEWGPWESCVNSCGDEERVVQMRHRLLSSVWIKEQCKESLQHLKFDKTIQSDCSFKCPNDPVKCYVSDWTEFSPCSASCSDPDEAPYMTRQRSVLLTAPQLTCPSLSETKPCHPPPPSCSSDCRVTQWSKWSNCDEECGAGTQTRTREVVKSSRNKRRCPKLEESRKCDSAVLENVSKSQYEYVYNVKYKALIKGSKIVAEGYFSGLDIGVPRINLETENGDTVFRLALRYDGRVEDMKILAQKKIVISTIYDKNWKYIPPNIDMPDFTAGNMRFTLSVQDTFEVKIEFGKDKILKIKSNVGTANSTHISRIVLRRRYPKTLLWDKELKLIEPKCIAVDCEVSEWGVWTVVQNRRARRRHVIVQPNKQGKQCPPLIESEDCTGDECPSVDCKVSNWADWSECQVSCLNKGMEEELVYQTRQRDIIVQPDKRGEKCPSLIEKRPCDPKPPACKIDCEVGEWSEWRFVTKNSGTVIKQRRRKITVDPENGGKRCPPLNESEDCTGDECPSVDCKVSNWADWSECQVSCLNKGMEEELVYQTRQRDIIVQPDKRGEKCPSLMEKRPCDPKPPACKIDCKVGKWGEWEFATIEKGAVIQERSRKITVDPEYGGKKCPSLTEFKDCSEVQCKLDCKLSEWTEYGECSGTCVSDDKTPVRKRQRKVLVQPKNGGKECGDQQLEEIQQCKHLPKCECANAEWTEWSECDKECGFGEQIRTRMRRKKSTGKCVKRKDAKKCYLKRCKKEKEDCEIGLWADWSPCTPECGSSRKRSRRRNVVINKKDAMCPPDTQTLPCEKIKCDKNTCPVSEWSKWEPCDCKTKKSASNRVVEKKGKCKKLTRRRDCEDEECQ